MRRNIHVVTDSHILCSMFRFVLVISILCTSCTICIIIILSTAYSSSCRSSKLIDRGDLISLIGIFRSRLRTLARGTHYHPTLDPAVLWTPSNDTARPIFSDSLNLTPPAPLYLRTLWRYTNAVIIIIIIIIIIIH